MPWLYRPLVGELPNYITLIGIALRLEAQYLGEMSKDGSREESGEEPYPLIHLARYVCTYVSTIPTQHKSGVFNLGHNTNSTPEHF